jgi:hypothetical protein
MRARFKACDRCDEGGVRGGAVESDGKRTITPEFTGCRRRGRQYELGWFITC